MIDKFADILFWGMIILAVITVIMVIPACSAPGNIKDKYWPLEMYIYGTVKPDKIYDNTTERKRKAQSRH